MKPVTDKKVVKWHNLTTDAVLSILNSIHEGLDSTEAINRLTQFGPNELQATHPISAFALLLAQLKNVMIAILLVATALSGLLGHRTEAAAIGIIVLFAVLLGFIQEYRAERAIDALRLMTAPTATAIRDGAEVELPARDLVPGDIILIKAGDKIPADARLIETFNLQTEEAPLTGESVPLFKQIEPVYGDDLAVGDRTNMIYAGTTACYGRGRAVVVETGMTTELGQVAEMLQTVVTAKTPLQQNLDRAGKILGHTALAIVIIIVSAGLFRGQPLIDMLIFGIALAVAVVPEALPAIVTISLSMGVQRMVRRHVLMRRLAAVETLGSTSVICSDKTGTLTKDEMTARSIVLPDESFEVTGYGYDPNGIFTRNAVRIDPPAGLLRLMTAAVLCSDAVIVHNESDDRWYVKGDPTEGALVVMAAKAGLLKTELDKKFPRINEIPFSSETGKMSTQHDTPDGVVVYSKGAPEIIIQNCSKFMSNCDEKKLESYDREAFLESARMMAGKALRVLAIASGSGDSFDTSENEMTFLGMVGMIDPPRPEAIQAIIKCNQAGIKVVMITGDHPLTAQAVARELGLLKNGRTVTGSELEKMTESELEQEAQNIEVYARVSPAHKLRIVTALQNNGHIVAMTGDGVNDAPALKKADIGIAMGITGTDVSKEAAAMTLTDDNFASIVAAVEEGRGIFGNIKKYLMYLLSANLGEIGLMLGASLLGMPLPLSAVQILYVNLATDGLPALALAVDPPEHDLMKRKPRDPHTGIFTRPVITLMLIGGIWSTVVNLGMFAWALHSGRDISEAMSMTFVLLVLIEFFKAYNFRSDRLSVFVRPLANKWLNRAIVWELLLLTLIIYLPFMNKIFGTFCLTANDCAVIIATAFTITPVLELAKWMIRHEWFGKLD